MSLNQVAHCSLKLTGKNELFVSLMSLCLSELKINHHSSMLAHPSSFYGGGTKEQRNSAGRDLN